MPKARPERTQAPPPAILGPEGEIQLSTLAGRPVELKDFGAPVTVVGTWAIWCAPCLEELPYLDALYEKYARSDDVNVIAVNIDPPSKRDDVRAMVRKLGLTMPVLVDGRPLFERLVEGGQRGLPLLAIISPEFDIYKITGFRPGISRQQYLAEKSILVDAVARGEKLPERRPHTAGRPPPGSTIKLKLPPVDPGDDAAIAAALERFRKGFSSAFPELTDEDLDHLAAQIEAALRRGDPSVKLTL